MLPAGKSVASFTKLGHRILSCCKTRPALSSQAAKASTVSVVNEPILDYAPGSQERQKVKEALKKRWSQQEDIPCVIGGKEIFTGNTEKEVAPFDHQHVLANVHYADKTVVETAIKTALEVREEWDRRPLKERVDILMKAADLISGKYRADLVASCMLGQAKTVFQAEIDIVCELADFYRFHGMYALDWFENSQPISTSESTNTVHCRGLEGFVAAIAPFNFTAIGGNLAGTPAMMGNAVLWKPSPSAVYSSFLVFNILREAGIPDGVINFVPADGPTFGDTVTSSPDLACVAFTGSTGTFKRLWQQVGENLNIYKTFPKITGECGGKNFHLIHPTADVESSIIGTLRSAYEFGGQKCSACSRLYVPESMWPAFKESLIEKQKQIKLGSPLDFTSFLSAVINEPAYKKVKSYVDYAKESPNLKVLAGGTCDDRVGYFVEPTLVEVSDPSDRIMKEEIFGPVISAYVYPDNKFDEIVNFIDNTSNYSLTGALFAGDSDVIDSACSVLRDTAGNFYVNDKSTGSVVGQQPFGGARNSGTNDKPGSALYPLRFVSPLTVKTTHSPLREWRYAHMAE
ncbi:LOW QUALITY PROTEIN: delta-1-pyrroline-5-carboxylate dehydrogenase, mitochondrial-like [Diadema setosum]|uniref:LOW QUALITY PROTEIN: delta-1-pyrroline-5-carboxylate dehydrogenase, mitochondrial-like n=1 Tax=Diadema setosum TaxID=31175 RepID=UPI003B3AE26F